MSSERAARWYDRLVAIRTRLLLVNVLIVAVPLLGILFARFYEREILASLEQDMIDQAELVRRFVADDPAGLRLDQRAPTLRAAAKRTRTRIRLLGAQGELLSDSHAGGPPEGPESPPPSLRLDADFESSDSRGVAPRQPTPPVDVSQREEVRRALTGRYGAATRFWRDRDTLYLFSALPIEKDARIAGVVYVTRSTNPVRAAMYRLRTTLLLTLLASLGVTVVFSWFLSGTISRPLTHLTRVAERIARGDRTQRLTLERRDEIGQLARAFDRMEQRLDDRARYIAELSADISHEFKSPLSGIRGAAELLAEGAADDPDARQRFLNNILLDAERLSRLVSRLLELSRAEASDAPSAVFDYEALVREVAQRVEQARIAGAVVPIDVVYHHPQTQLFGRPALLASVLSNLLENATQHAAPNSRVELRISRSPRGAVSTEVHNHGSPISEANLTRIWDRFFTTRAEAGGTGLGLPIAKTIVESHGGTLTVQSSAEHGTVFRFELPSGAPTAPD